MLPLPKLRILECLQLTLPKHKKKSKAVANGALTAQANGEVLDSETDKKRRLFPGLSVPDQEITKDVLMKEVDDMMAQFEGAAKKGRPRMRMEALR